MNKKIEKAKEFVNENKYGIVLALTFVSGALIGHAFGQASMIPLRDQIMAEGIQAATLYIRANGLEKTEEFIKNCYKIK